MGNRSVGKTLLPLAARQEQLRFVRPRIGGAALSLDHGLRCRPSAYLVVVDRCCHVDNARGMSRTDHPMPVKVQRKQLARDLRAIERAMEIFERLRRNDLGKNPIGMVLQGLKNGSYISSGYPISEETGEKQRLRDIRKLNAALEVIDRLSIQAAPRRGLFTLAVEALQEWEREIPTSADQAE